MHLHTEVVVAASTRDEARERAEALLRKSKAGLGWDWYQIGGRWRGIHTGRVQRGEGRHPTEWDEHPLDIAEAGLVVPREVFEVAYIVTEDGIDATWRELGPHQLPRTPGTFLVTVDIHV